MSTERDVALDTLNARRWRVAVLLSTVTVVVTCAFLVLVAYDRPVMSILLSPGVSVGIVLGSLMFLLAWVVTGVYVFWANRYYDPALRRLHSARS
jgi:uncharacterized membrane protein (DUF485 family)